jgi:hypothetical protein
VLSPGSAEARNSVFFALFFLEEERRRLAIRGNALKVTPLPESIRDPIV